MPGEGVGEADLLFAFGAPKFGKFVAGVPVFAEPPAELAFSGVAMPFSVVPAAGELLFEDEFCCGLAVGALDRSCCICCFRLLFDCADDEFIALLKSLGAITLFEGGVVGGFNMELPGAAVVLEVVLLLVPKNDCASSDVVNKHPVMATTIDKLKITFRIPWALSEFHSVNNSICSRGIICEWFYEWFVVSCLILTGEYIPDSCFFWNTRLIILDS